MIRSSTVRVSTLQTTLLAQQSLQRAQSQLLRAQTEVQTGRKLINPSDNPGDAQVSLLVRRTLERNAAHQANLRIAQTQLSHTDNALSEVNSLLNEAKSLASGNVGSGVTADQRASSAAVVRSIYTQVLALANRQVEGLYLFGGDRGTAAPYIESQGGVKFVGSANAITNAFDDNTLTSFTATGDTLFGSGKVSGSSADLAPAVLGSTLLSDLRGASGNGVRNGSLLISNGTTSATIDLTDASDLQDVIDRINAAAIPGITASLSTSGINLSAGGANLTVNEVGGGSIATDLGILRTATSGLGVTLTGGALSPKVTELTPLSSLLGGTGLDVTSGLLISSGTSNVAIDFTGATSVQDLLSRINSSVSGAVARINASGNGIEILNPVQGLELRVAENGGTLASTLGVRSLGPNSVLSGFNNGLGVRRSDSSADLRITAKDGTVFDVELSSAQTLDDVITAINTATGGSVVAGIPSTGNGLILTDSTGGAGALTVSSLNFSTTAQDLGIQGTTAGTQLTGTDPNPVSVSGIFSALLKLQRALETNDTTAITQAGEELEPNLQNIIRQRGVIGAKAQEVESRISRLTDETITLKSNLSDIEEVDLTEAITKYTLLQTTLEANLRTVSQTLNLSLLDFIR